MSESPSILYWDASAVISALLPDPDHEEAVGWTRSRGTHIISTLVLAEVLAVISRLHRQGRISSATADSAREEIERPPWTHLQQSPDWTVIREIASKWTLRGADLWHLALAKTLQQEQPELRLLSVDDRLSKAAAGEGLAPATATSAT